MFWQVASSKYEVWLGWEVRIQKGARQMMMYAAYHIKMVMWDVSYLRDGLEFSNFQWQQFRLV